MLPVQRALDHLASHPLGAEDHVLEVGAVEGVPSVLRRLEEGRVEDAPCVVDEDADGSQFGHRALERRIDLIRLPDVDLEPEATHLFAGGGRRVLGALPDGHLGAEGGEVSSDAPPDAGPAAGDDGHPIGEQD